MREEELYPDIERWLNGYIKSKYKGKVFTTYESSKRNISAIIESLGEEFNLHKLIPYYEALELKVDIVGFVFRKDTVGILIIEVKRNKITLKDIAQCLGYAKIINPLEAYIVSPVGFSPHVFKLLKTYNKSNLLKYDEKQNKYIKPCRWDMNSKSVRFGSCLI